jgi:hypothetical protein
MKKVLKIAGVLAVLLLVALGLGIYFGLNSAVKAGVQEVLPEITGTKVVLDSANLAPWSGSGELSGFLIGNPEGFNTDHAFRLGRVFLKVQTASVFSDTVVIDEIIVEEPHVVYERALTRSNISKIQENVDAFAARHGVGESEEPEKPTEDAKPGKKVIIKRFLMRGGKVSLSAKLLQGNKLTLPLPTIELTDIGKPEEPVTTAEAAKRVFEPVTKTVSVVGKTGLAQAERLLKAGKKLVVGAGGIVIDSGAKVVGVAGKGVKTVGGAVLGAGGKAVDVGGKVIRKTGEGVKAVGKGITNVGTGAAQKTKDVVGGAISGVKGLLGGGDKKTTTEPKSGD